MKANRTQPARHDAFTLIEMLVVIAIIGILAGMFIGIYPGIKEKGVRNRVRAEIASLVVAIEDYKHDQGFYPPDNRNNAAQPPLFYELVGTTFDGTSYKPLNGATNMAARTLKDNPALLGVDGFVNVQDVRPGANSKPSKNYLPSLKDTEYAITTITNAAVELNLLRAPYKGPDGEFNTWRYNSSSPEHNPGSFDLWAEITFGNKTTTIGNWR